MLQLILVRSPLAEFLLSQVRMLSTKPSDSFLNLQLKYLLETLETGTLNEHHPGI